MDRSTVTALFFGILIMLVSWQAVGLLSDTDRTPGAGAATFQSGPGCLEDTATQKTGSVTVIPNKTDAGLIVNTTVVHDRGQRPNVTLRRESSGVYILSIEIKQREESNSDETTTQQRVRDRCQVGNHIESHGRMGLNPDRIVIIAGGETILNRTVPDGRTTWEIPRVIDLNETNKQSRLVR